MLSDSLKKDSAIAKSLRLTWDAFFDKFGRLTEAQRSAIPNLLQGKDMLISAPTASGKTEAVCAPLLESNLPKHKDWLILYISPTRALVNDLSERLNKPLGMLDINAARYTGDHHDSLKNARILITTPESFDSMLCRGKTNRNGHMLASVSAVVLDEIHFLFGNPRGEQLRWIIERLRRLRKFAKAKGWTDDDSLQIAAISATIATPESVRESYLLPDAEMAIVSGGRSIETVHVDSSCPGTEDALIAYVEQLNEPEKILVFSNARKRVDNLSSSLKKKLSSLGYVVKAHHGSLSKKMREQAEGAMKSKDKVVLFATSTLEIGIDIGNIDLVVLDGPASDIQTLLQRIGRGNRRTNQTRVMTCSGSMAEVIIHSAMIECARKGMLGPSEYGPCYAVARQQIASFIFQAPKRARSRQLILEFMTSVISKDHAESILDHLILEGEFIDDADGIRLGDDWLDRSERGSIHSNIEGMIGMTVVDKNDGTEIAHGINFKGGSNMKIGGHHLKVKSWTDTKVEVERLRSAGHEDSSWSYCSRAWVQGPGQPNAVREYLGYSKDVWPMIKVNVGVCVFHFGGGRRKSIIEMIIAISSGGLKDIKVNEWFLKLPYKIDKKPEWITAVGPATLELGISDNLAKLERSLGRPGHNKKLPEDVRIIEVKQWLNLEGEIEDFTQSVWLPEEEETNLKALNLLANQI